MIPIHELLNRIKWDDEFGRAEFIIGYHDRFEKGIIKVALTELSFDEKDHKYRWQSWRVPGGYFNEHEPAVTENGFSWSIETPRGVMKYTLRLTENGEWHEIGEYSRDGEQWQKFFNMLLRRVD